MSTIAPRTSDEKDRTIFQQEKNKAYYYAKALPFERKIPYIHKAFSFIKIIKRAAR